jgi:nickel transport protein
MRKIMLIFTTGLFVFFTLNMFSHGVSTKIINKGIVGIRFAYEGGNPFSNVKVKIYSPDDASTPFIVASTDTAGYVYFAPTKRGEWIIVAKDEGGHAKRVNLNVDESFAVQSAASGNLNSLQKLILGIAVVWGFIGTALFFKSRKAKK